MSTKTIQGGLEALDYLDLAMISISIHSQEEKIIAKKALDLNKGIFVKKVLNSGNLNKEDINNSIKSVLSIEGISSIIVGSINKNHLLSNIDLVNKITKYT